MFTFTLHVHVTDAYPIWQPGLAWTRSTRIRCRYPDMFAPGSLSYDGGVWDSATPTGSQDSAANSPNYVTLMIFCICTVRELQEPTGTAERIGMRPRSARTKAHRALGTATRAPRLIADRLSADHAAAAATT